MRRLLVAAVVVVALVVAGAGVWRSEPAWLDRARYPLRYDDIVRAHADNYQLAPELLAAVIYVESRFDARARSAAGALGLMQLLPETARGIALRTGGNRFVVSDLYVPEINIRYGAWYLRNLIRKYHDQTTALAAYHAGQGNVDTWRKQGSGIQFPETRSYVERVQQAEQIYRRAYANELRLTPAP